MMSRKLIFYEEVQKVAEKRGEPFAWDRVDREKLSNEKTHELCKWIIKNKKIPSRFSNNKKEEYLGIFRNSRCVAKEGKRQRDGKWYGSDDKVAKSYGLNNIFLFKKRDGEKKSNQKCIELCKWIKKYGYIPKQSSSDIYEKKMAKYLNYLRNVKNKKENKKAMRGIFYLSNLKIVKSYGIKNLFDIQSLEKKSNQKCIELCKWIKNNNQLPHKNERNRDLNISKRENNLCHWLGWRRNNKKSKLLKGKFYQSDLDIAIKYGYPDLFDSLSFKFDVFEKRSNNMCVKVCDFIKNNNHYPNSNSLNFYEKTFARWLIKERIKYKIKDKNFYESNLKIAKKYGCDNLFIKKYKNFVGKDKDRLQNI